MAQAWKKADTVKNFLDVRGGIPFAAEQLEVMVTMLRTVERPIRKVLDLGCGTGIVGMAVLGEFPEASCDFVDYSEAMLKILRRNLGGNLGCKVFQADLEKQSLLDVLDSRRYDAVVSGFALHHLTEMRKPEIYGEIFEVLEPGGAFLNMEHVSSSCARSEGIWNEKIIDGQFQYHASQGGQKTREQCADEYHARADKDDNILELVELQCATLSEIGFADVDVYFKYFELAVFGGFKRG